MDFSEAFKCVGPPQFSPDGMYALQHAAVARLIFAPISTIVFHFALTPIRYVASCVDMKLSIRAVASLRVVASFVCMDTVSSCEWSPDSQCVRLDLAFFFPRAA
jgi:hypothetical protein